MAPYLDVLLPGLSPGLMTDYPSKTRLPPRNAVEENMQLGVPLDNRRHAQDKSLTKHQRRDSEKEAKGTTSSAPYSAGYGKTIKKKRNTTHLSKNLK